jgi:uncharacterized protein (TIGR02271 family)
MAQRHTYRKGMQVYGNNDRPLGQIDAFDNDSFTFQGRRYGHDAVSRLEGDRIYLNESSMRSLGNLQEREGSVRVPVMEERLDVEKRAVQAGEVGIRKEVTEERVNVPVELTREEVRVERVDVQDRPVNPGDMDTAFKEGTIRVPVRAEQAFVEKEAVVTGEVVINKERVSERQTVSDTVRKEHVDVDENYRQFRPEFERHFNERQSRPTTGRQTGTSTTTTGTTTGTSSGQTRAVGGTTGRSFADAEPNYRYGFTAAHDQRFQGRRFNEVESDLRRDYETSSVGGGRTWEDVREEVGEGFDRMRRR